MILAFFRFLVKKLIAFSIFLIQSLYIFNPLSHVRIYRSRSCSPLHFGWCIRTPQYHPHRSRDERWQCYIDRDGNKETPRSGSQKSDILVSSWCYRLAYYLFPRGCLAHAGTGTRVPRCHPPPLCSMEVLPRNPISRASWGRKRMRSNILGGYPDDHRRWCSHVTRQCPRRSRSKSWKCGQSHDRTRCIDYPHGSSIRIYSKTPRTVSKYPMGWTFYHPLYCSRYAREVTR